MEYQTPQQIAQDYVARHIDLPLDGQAIGYWITRIAEAIEADRAQRAERLRGILATDDAVSMALDEMGIDWTVYQPNREQVEQALVNVALTTADAIEANRAQREMTRGHIVEAWTDIPFEITEADDAVEFVKRLGIVVTG